jgi:MFS family permease
LRLAPIAIATTILNAAIETAGLSFLALCAIGSGWADTNATQLISAMMFGAIVLQLPIGWLDDKIDHRPLVLAFGLLPAGAALAVRSGKPLVRSRHPVRLGRAVRGHQLDHAECDGKPVQ